MRSHKDSGLSVEGLDMVVKHNRGSIECLERFVWALTSHLLVYVTNRVKCQELRRLCLDWEEGEKQ